MATRKKKADTAPTEEPAKEEPQSAKARLERAIVERLTAVREALAAKGRKLTPGQEREQEATLRIKVRKALVWQPTKPTNSPAAKVKARRRARAKIASASRARNRQ